MSQIEKLINDGILKAVDVEAASRLLNGTDLNAALWVTASTQPETVFPKAIIAFDALSSGLLK